MRIFFSVGEPSGDLHGSNLIHRLKSQRPDIECVGFGGPKMAEAGCELHFELTTLAVMFIGAVLKNLRLFFRLIDQANDYFRDHDVDAVVLIDYPGFNWWIARKAKRHNIPVFYYGVPQVWAWAPWRVRKIRRLVDHVLCKLPFEVDWFAQRGVAAKYVGHPYFDELAGKQYDEPFIAAVLGAKKQLLTLLPGSRDSEVTNNLPILLNSANLIGAAVPELKIAVACFNPRQLELAQQLLNERSSTGTIDLELFVNRTPELMRAATVCLACSGSVSLELLYHRKPTVIVYKIKRWVMLAQSVMLRTRFITLANLIATDKIRKTTWRPYDPDVAAAGSATAVMPEYLTVSDPSEKVARHAIEWLTDAAARQKKVEQLDRLAQAYAKPGATDAAADFILQQLLSGASCHRVYHPNSLSAER